MMKRLNKLFVTIFCLCTLAFAGKTMAQTYDPVAVTVINNLIDNNGLTGYAKDSPETWNFALWSELEPFQLIELDFYSADVFDLTGAVSFAGLAELTYLDCYGNSITALDLAGCAKLEWMDCSYNFLTELDVSGFVNLLYLDCYENMLTQLDVRGCINLEELDCEENQLMKLDVSTLINLVYLDCSENQLMELDVSNLKYLGILYCYENNLTQLNVSGCRSLESLDCEDNHLTALDLTGLNYLGEFYGDNQTVDILLDRKYSCEILLNNPIFDESAISYSNGVLTSADKTVQSTYFTVETGINGYKISGLIYLIYPMEGVSEVSQKEKLRTYPNPATDQLTINLPNPSEGGAYEIYNIVGQVVMITPNLSKGGESPLSFGEGQGVRLDISHLANGMYFLKINNQVVKFVKE